MILALDGVIPQDQLEQYVGTVNGLRAAQVQLAYLTAFFRESLSQRRSPLLRGPSRWYPDVRWLASSGVDH